MTYIYIYMYICFLRPTEAPCCGLYIYMNQLDVSLRNERSRPSDLSFGPISPFIAGNGWASTQHGWEGCTGGCRETYLDTISVLVDSTCFGGFACLLYQDVSSVSWGFCWVLAMLFRWSHDQYLCAKKTVGKIHRQPSAFHLTMACCSNCFSIKQWGPAVQTSSNPRHGVEDSVATGPTFRRTVRGDCPLCGENCAAEFLFTDELNTSPDRFFRDISKLAWVMSGEVETVLICSIPRNRWWKWWWIIFFASPFMACIGTFIEILVSNFDPGIHMDQW